MASSATRAADNRTMKLFRMPRGSGVLVDATSCSSVTLSYPRATKVMLNNTLTPARTLRKRDKEELAALMDRGVSALTEDDALSIIDHPFVTSAIIQKIAHDPRLSSFYAVRLKLVAHPKTPQMYAAKLVHYLHWPDLVRLSVDVMVPAPVRRAIDTQLLARVTELTLGQRISSARRCSQALIKHFLFDPDPKVFLAPLVNQHLREDQLLALIASAPASP